MNIESANVVFTPDGKYLTAHGQNRQMIVWDTATGKKVKTLGKGVQVEAAAFSPDSQRAAAFEPRQLDRVGHGLRARNFGGARLATGRISGWDKVLAFSPDGKTLALGHWKNVPPVGR